MGCWGKSLLFCISITLSVTPSIFVVAAHSPNISLLATSGSKQSLSIDDVEDEDDDNDVIGNTSERSSVSVKDSLICSGFMIGRGWERSIGSAESGTKTCCWCLNDASD